MKAIQVPKTGGAEVLTLVEIPTPKPKPNEVLVKISAAGVNYIDVQHREGRYPVTPPFILGQEASGLVSEVGSDVKDFKPGERVAYTGITGAYAEYEAVPADRLVRVPAGITDHQAGAAMLQGMNAHYLTHSTDPLKKGDIALIHAAAGGVGLLLVQMSKNLGARVIATVSTEEKAKIAREAGADDVIFYINRISRPRPNASPTEREFTSSTTASERPPLTRISTCSAHAAILCFSEPPAGLCRCLTWASLRRKGLYS